MAMGTRKDRERQEDLWVAYTDMAVGPGHPFYVRLNEVLDGEGFDAFVEKLCARFYAEKLGRPGLTPGIYFRSLMIGYFEGLESERGNLWRRLTLPAGIEDWSLTSLQQRLVKTGGRLVKHARYYWMMLAEGHLTRTRFAAMLRRIALLPLPAN
jgi:hypothetical protein